MSNLVATIYSLTFAVILAESSSASKAVEFPCSSVPQFAQEFCSNNPWLGWVYCVFWLLIIAVPFVATYTGHLQKIIDFCKNNLLRKQAEVSEQELLKLRKQLLERLESDISIRQRNSLHNLIKIDLEMEEQRQRVGGNALDLVPEDRENSNLINRVFRLFHRDDCQTTQLRPTQKIIDFFDRDDIQGKLLILGEPGAGKTTELLSLAEDLIQSAIEDENAPIPIIFELSTWNKEQPTWKKYQAIRDWLIEQLSDIYKGIPKDVAEQWIDNQEIIPLLDGLDELGLEGENKCIVAINEFLVNNSFQPGLVVCCRQEEYEQAQNKLDQLNGAIYLQPLSDEQIQQYLESLRRSSIWHKTIINQPSLLELCRKPLFLTMLVVAYQGKSIRNQSNLFDAYIEKQLNNPDLQGTYPPGKSPSQKQTLHYLVWLAKKLQAKEKTEFSIEEIQITWLETTEQRDDYSCFVGLIFGLIEGLIFGLLEGYLPG